jgi:hypothetical protein
LFKKGGYAHTGKEGTIHINSKWMENGVEGGAWLFYFSTSA